jgi:outer membrane usher protein
MPRHNGADSNPAVVPIRALALVCMLATGPRVTAAEAPQPLQLAVTINGTSADEIGSFVLIDGKRIGATGTELEAVGIHVDPAHPSGDLVMLDDLPSLKYHYDDHTQSLDISIDNALRRGQDFDLAAPAADPTDAAKPGWGAVLNYDLLANAGSVSELSPFSASGSSLTLDGRGFSPLGTFEQSAIVSVASQKPASLIRLGTEFRVSDPHNLVTYKAGDLINGGVAWSRPIRVGGFEAESNFALRPDLITTPLPTLGGIAAVPSTVDVYINNARAFSGDVTAGPYTLDNVPVTTGAGTAQVIVRDAAGHETETSVPFFASPALLRPGLDEWSADAGLPRLGYGSAGDFYAPSLVGSATWRHGFNAALTGEAHAEGGAGILNGGVGAVFKTGEFGVASAALAASRGPFGIGAQAFLSYQTSLWGINVSASLQRGFGPYEDLAAATAQSPSGGPSAAFYLTSGPPRELEGLNLSAPLPFDPQSSLSASYVRQVDALGNRAEILSAAYSRPMPFGGSFYANVFRDFAGGNTGVYLGLNMPLGASTSVSTGVASAAGRSTITSDIVRPLGPDTGSLGWRLRDAEGAVPYREASASYRAGFGTATLDARSDSTATTGSLELRGGIAAMDGGVFFSDWIDDGFAVVKTGTPGVKVLNENRLVGVTGSNGMLLVPGLRAYQSNKIAIDPTDLPVDTEAGTTRQIVAPADGAGVAVDFDVQSDGGSALVTFKRPDGSPVPVGAEGQLASGGDFVVGYDGQAFIHSLAASNHVSIQFLDGACKAEFGFTPRRGQQVGIGPVLCK